MYLRKMLILAILAVLILLISIKNPGDVHITLPGIPYLTGDVFVVPSKIALMLGSAGFGMLVVILGLYIKATGDFFRNWKNTRIQQEDVRVQTLYSKGLNSMLSRRNDVAATHFEKVLALRPNHAETLLRLGSIYHKDGDYAEAIKLHQRAMHADPKNIEVLFALALDYEDARRTEDALQMLDDILEKDDGNLRALSRIRDICLRMGDFEKAEKVQERILKISLPAKEAKAEQERLTGIRYETGRVLLEDGNLDKAGRVFKVIVKTDDTFVPAYLGLGEVYLEEGNNADAAKLWEDAYRRTGSIIFLHRLEDLYLKLGTPSRIINLYKEALISKPTDVTLNFFLGKLYYRLEMVDNAYEVLGAIDSSNRQLPDLHKLLGNLYFRRGQSDKAVEELKKALSFRDQLIVPYKCGNCEYFTTDWSGRCPKCGVWNSYEVDLDKYC